MVAGTVDLASSPGQAAGRLADLLAPHILSFLNVHTAEALAVPYGLDGKVVPGAMPAVRHLLHDHHDGSDHEIDSKLLDVLFTIVQSVGGGGSHHAPGSVRLPFAAHQFDLAPDR